MSNLDVFKNNKQFIKGDGKMLYNEKPKDLSLFDTSRRKSNV